ncbi:MAG: LysR family transcriptional regulator [Lachnospiraceae bacterium]|nr:LysR family transcriptional regulator [Lachnospiraceae bacterium]
MNTQILEYMIVISEEKSLTKAADRLLVTQPALSRQLKKLETELGTKLFLREKNEMILTDAGKVYVNGARSVLSIYENALSEIRRLRTSGRKSITMIYNNALLPIFSSEILPAFRELHSSIFISTIDGNASIAKNYLTNSMADLAVLATNDPSHSMLEYIPLRSEELMLAIPSDHSCIPSFRKSGVDFQLLKQEPFILNQINSHFRTLEREIFIRYQFTPNVLCEISDLNASKNMVSNHKGIAFLPSSMAQDSDRYVCFSLDPPATFHIVIAYHKSMLLTKPVRDLILLLLKAYDSSCSD